MSRRRMFIWGVSAFVYAVFVSWYTDFGGPLRDAEIAEYLDRPEALTGAERWDMGAFFRYRSRQTSWRS